MIVLNPKAFGARIGEVRKLKQLSQDELAVGADCSRRTIINLEAGGSVSLHTVFRVFACLGLAVDILDKRVDVLRSLRELQERDE
ncbi:helix-turn-helix domain-containing protein [Pseudomonas putida]|uniref:helix-turn-helix domain-containing protein n=1 Tax=Pseudomonas putida TaxID=303 RepID=UPI00236455B6|nr:helix-turn-helix transcriptional regulator [Pseudomonas putida]MDD2005657.1 helix-turn-helix domain-containing protein [Pseudomonas putida]